MSSARILLVEDDLSIIRNLAALLEQEGFFVVCAGCQRDALAKLAGESFDLLLLDLSLPDGSGYAVCTAARRQGNTPVFFLTATDDEAAAVTAFELGADDYITKPFRPQELLSRIRAALRRRECAQTVYECADVRLDPSRGVVTKNGREIFLSALEYRVLLLFFTNRGIILTRERLLEGIWDIAGDFVNDNTLTVYIKRLREKIEDDPKNPEIIRTVRGLGYKAGQ